VRDGTVGAVELAGLLADERRRRIVAALVLGACSRDEVRSRAALTPRDFVTALGRLVDSGLVVDDANSLSLAEGVFRDAARRPPRPLGERDSDDRVLRAFIDDGRLRSIPASRAKRLVVLGVLAQEFEPGKHYTEKAVNLILGKWHADVASLRRYLVDEQFLARAEGRYWRCGGSVST